MSDFLPQDYTAPSGSGDYMKFQKGDNKFRILSKPIIGWVDWKDKKPFRFPMKNKPDRPMGDQPIKHFWAFIVYDYTNPGVKILEITQSSIQTAIASLSKNEDWGAPFEYDLKVNKTGEGMDTEYSVMPSPKKPLSEEIKKMAMEKPCYLDALFSGADPWAKNDKNTDLAFMDLPF